MIFWHLKLSGKVNTLTTEREVYRVIKLYRLIILKENIINNKSIIALSWVFWVIKINYIIIISFMKHEVNKEIRQGKHEVDKGHWIALTSGSKEICPKLDFEVPQLDNGSYGFTVVLFTFQEIWWIFPTFIHVGKMTARRFFILLPF